MRRTFILFVWLVAGAGIGGYFLQQGARWQAPDPGRQQRAVYSNHTKTRAPLAEQGGSIFSGARTRFRILHIPLHEVFGVLDPKRHKQMDAEWLERQTAVIRSPEVLGPAVKRLNPEADWALTDEAAMARVRESLEIRVTEGTNVVSIAVRCESPMTSVTIANAVRDAYEEFLRGRIAERRRRLHESIRRELEV